MKETIKFQCVCHEATAKLIRIRAAELGLTQGQYLDRVVFSDTQANSDYKGEVVQFPPLRSV